MQEQRMTKQKQLVLNVVQAHHDHPTADQIYLEVHEVDEHISRATVFRNLSQLSEAGNILQIKVSGANRFESRLDYHYHVVCERCGAFLDVPLTYQENLDAELAEETGFLVKRHRTVFEGICPSCRKKMSEKNW